MGLKIEIKKNENHPDFYNVHNKVTGEEIGSIQKVIFQGKESWDIDIQVRKDYIYTGSEPDFNTAYKKAVSDIAKLFKKK